MRFLHPAKHLQVQPGADRQSTWGPAVDCRRQWRLSLFQRGPSADRRGDTGHLAAARRVLSVDRRAEIVSMVAENPDGGVPLGGGVRKARIARPGGGKSGGARVVFLSVGEDIPLFLLTVFAKNEKANLSAGERTAMIATAKELAADYRRAS